MTVLVKQNEKYIQQSTWQNILKPQRLLEVFKIKIHNTRTIHSLTRQGLGGLCYTQNVTHRADGEIFLLGSLMSGKSPSNSPPLMTSHKPSSMLMSPGNGCSSGLSAMTRPNRSPVLTKLDVASHPESTGSVYHPVVTAWMSSIMMYWAYHRRNSLGMPRYRPAGANPQTSK